MKPLQFLELWNLADVPLLRKKVMEKSNMQEICKVWRPYSDPTYKADGL